MSRHHRSDGYALSRVERGEVLHAGEGLSGPAFCGEDYPSILVLDMLHPRGIEFVDRIGCAVCHEVVRHS